MTANSSNIGCRSTLFAAMLFSIFPAQSQDAEEIRKDIETNGIYESRHFARIVGPAIDPLPQEKEPEVPGKFLVEHSSRESNEIVLMLQKENIEELARVVPAIQKGMKTAEVERIFISSVGSRGSSISRMLGNPLHIRYMIQTSRLTDAERELEEEISIANKKAGKSENPRELLQRFLVLRYESVELARAAEKNLKERGAFKYFYRSLVGGPSAVPSDPYFSRSTPPAATTEFQYQWGMNMMNFPTAWDSVRGQAYIGVLDADWPGAVVGSTISVHPDLESNFRRHLIEFPITANGAQLNHTVHVTGIIAATHSNGRVAGACPDCSFVPYPLSLDGAPSNSETHIAERMAAAVENGMQVINWSGGIPASSLGGPPVECDQTGVVGAAAICVALEYATLRSVLVVTAAGNFNQQTVQSGPQFPGNLHDGHAKNFSVLPVGGISPTGERWSLSPAMGENEGSDPASLKGVVGPAEGVASTFMAGTTLSSQHPKCADSSAPNYYDLSAGRFPGSYGDGVGSCTGTSMAAPHISGLAGLVRSIHPRATAQQVRDVIRMSGSRSGTSPLPQPDRLYGHGLPDAAKAVTKALALNPKRLTPLFSMYSTLRMDSLYTTVPQMVRAAVNGRLQPKTSSGNSYAYKYGNSVVGYSLPDRYGAVFGGSDPSLGNPTGKAEFWIFTTNQNPLVPSAPLRQIYRMSYKCGDYSPMPPALCTSRPYHLDSVLVGRDEIPYFTYLGYKVDGVEGFVFPLTQAQPSGTVKMMRKYNPARDDHAIFPFDSLSMMNSQGYTANTNSVDSLGYAYPNTTGNMPSVPW